MLKRFAKDTTGNMIIMFAVVMLMILAGAGAAGDYNSMSSKNNNFHSIADSVLLGAA